MKTYVLIVSQSFPKSHPRSGEYTHFEKNIPSGVKKHTVRNNYELWSKRAEEVNAGRAEISVRNWSMMPYRSKQKEICRLTKIGVQKISINMSAPQIIIDDRRIMLLEMQALAANDGLSWEDFKDWFKTPVYGGCIIHFTDYKY